MNALLLFFLDRDWFPEQVRRLEALIARLRAGAESHQPS
jgi:hypothetical protein